jgi:hypothetical protein
MAIDFFAVASNGYFPTPTPAAEARMAFASTWGYLGTLPAAVAVLARRVSWLSKFIHRRR